MGFCSADSEANKDQTSAVQKSKHFLTLNVLSAQSKNKQGKSWPRQRPDQRKYSKEFDCWALLPWAAVEGDVLHRVGRRGGRREGLTEGPSGGGHRGRLAKGRALAEECHGGRRITLPLEAWIREKLAFKNVDTRPDLCEFALRLLFSMFSLLQAACARGRRSEFASRLFV